jgi:hypothetical protein
MPLIRAELLFDRVRTSRCVMCSTSHGRSSIMCAACDPADSTAALVGQKKSVCLTVLGTIKDSAAELLCDGDVALRIRQWMASLIAKGDRTLEAVLHAYIYLFWDSLCFDDAVIVPSVVPGRTLYFTSESLEASGAGANEPSDMFVKRLSRLARADLIGLDHKVHHILLVEIKRGSLDDRGLGQLLRYYDACNRLLTTHDCRALNLSYVRPILIVESIDKQAWLAIPQYFRDIVDIFRYRLRLPEAIMTLENVRKGMLSN